MNFQKRCVVLITTLCALSLTACDSADNNNQENAVTTQKTTTTEPIENKNVINNDFPTYTIATMATYPPFATKNADGIISGFDVDIIKAIAEVQEFNAEFVARKWDGWKLDLKDGRVDVWAAGVTIKDERKEFTTFTEPYLSDHTAILVVDRDGSMDLSDKNVANMKIGVEAKTTAVAIASKLVSNPSQIEEFKSNFKALEKLIQKDIDAIIGNEIVLAHMSEGFPEYSFKLKTLATDGKPKKLAYMLKKGDEKLVTDMNEGLKAIKENGKFNEIKKKWFGDLIK